MAARDAVPGGEHARALHVVPARLGGPKREIYGVRPWADASVVDLVGVTVVLLHYQLRHGFLGMKVCHSIHGAGLKK